MSVQVEKLEKNMAKLTVEVSAEDLRLRSRKRSTRTRTALRSQVSVKEKLLRL